MSPAAYDLEHGLLGFPRVSGDEPWTNSGGVPTGVFSPRERG